MSAVLGSGSSSGIALATGLHFARRGPVVFAGCPGSARDLPEAIETARPSDA